jgi:hypothetical protein
MKKMHVGRMAMTLLVTFTWVLTASAASADIRETIERSFTVTPGGWLHLETDKGAIEVRTSPEPKVDVLVDLRADTASERKARDILEAFRVDIAQLEHQIRIEARFDSDHSSFWDRDRKRLKVRFVIQVPQQYNLSLSTTGGSINVADIEGDVSSRTSGGSLRFGSITGSLEAKTSGGSIRLKACTGPAKVKTSGGSIRIATAAGTVSAETSGGSIQVEEVMGAIDARTSGGSIEAFISKQPDASCSLSTSGGSIDIYLAQDVGLDVDAKTSGGSVRTDFPVTVIGELKRSALKGQINAGGPTMYLRTSGGNIRLLKH